MSRFLTADQASFRDTAREFAQKEVEPLAHAIDSDDIVPESLIETCRELNLFGLYTPEKYGGLGKDLTNSCLVLEEIAKVSPSLAGLLSVEIVLCPGAIDQTGTEEQKQRFLPASASGQKPLAWSMSEPAGAGNVGRHQTRLVAGSDGYRLNGHKLFTTMGNAHRILVMTVTNRDGQQGYGCVVVDRSAPGVEVAPCEPKLGWHGTNTGPVSYTDVAVAEEDVLGDLLTGLADLAPVNQASFVAHSATSLGAAEGLLEKTVAHVKDRVLYDTPMDRLQPISYWLAEVQAKIEASRSLIYDAARLCDEGRPDPTLGAVCKAYVCDTMFDCTSKLLQMWGGSGIMDSTGVNRYFRDARTNMIAEASSEMHYDAIAAELLGRNPVSAGG